MVKKRGGRRGKVSNAPPSQPVGGTEPIPSTSGPPEQPPQQRRASDRALPKKHQKESGRQAQEVVDPTPQVQPVTASLEEAPASCRGPRSGDLPEMPQPVWRRGKGRETPSPRPGDVPPQAWTGGRPQQEKSKPSPESTQQVLRQEKGRAIASPRSGDMPEQARSGARTRHEKSTPLPTSKVTPAQTQGGDSSVLAPVKTSGTASGPLSLSEIAKLVLFKPGVLGRKIRIETNHVRLNLGTLETAYRYDVSIEPEKKPKRMLREAMKLFQMTYYVHNNPSYDGQKLLYSATRLPLKEDTASGTVTVKTDKAEGSTQDFKITVKLTGTLDLTPLRNLLQKKNIGQDEAFQCVEVVFRQAYVNSFVNVGRRFYTESTGNNYPLGSGAVMYLGGYQAAVKGWIPYLNTDVAHKAFTISTPLTNVLIDMFSTRNRPLRVEDLPQYKMSRWQKDQMSGYLKGLKVVYQLPSSRKVVYRVNALSNPAIEERFQYEGQPTTVFDYFKDRYHYKWRYPNLPTLWVGSSDKRILIPLELCTLKEGQPIEGTRLIGAQTSQMINYSATSTRDRKRKIQTIMQTAAHNNNPCIQEFGFSIDPNFEIQDARVLDPPQLQYLDGTVEPKKGAWWAKKFKKGAQVDKWTIVGFGVMRDRVARDVNDLAKMLQDYGKSSGMTFGKPEEPFDYIRNNKQSLASYLQKKKHLDLIVVVIPSDQDSYYMVKQEAEQRIGLLTQCIKSGTRLNESTVRNILLKINCKMNGTNHILKTLSLITDQPCMVMGADVTHPSPQARTIPSVVAVTASNDLTATNYGISVYLQKPRTGMSEMIQKLDAITLEKLRLIVQKTGKEPERIYFFRDGVSDGEFDRVREVEVQAIKRACQTFKRGYNPKLTFLVVQKRHHTRFFPSDKNSLAGDKGENVPSGTCVDSVITDPTMQNFYLLSHQSVKGVGRPTKYCVLYDENEFINDDVEKLTYYLCHLYTRCNKAVSYPAPTYFAHLAADRAKGYLYKKNIDLENLDPRLVQINTNLAAKNPMFFS